MSRSTSWSVSHSTVRIALATTAVATLAVIAACSDGGVADKVAAPSSSVRLGQSVGPSIANAKLATVCVSNTSPDGTYTFQNSALDLQVATGTTVPNAGNGVDYTLTKNGGNPNPCVDVLTRTSVIDTTALFDSFSAATVTNTATPAGVNYSSTDCVDDPGVQVSSPCANPSTIHANKFHGSKATFNFVNARIPTPLFVIGDVEPHSPLGFANNSGKTKKSTGPNDVLTGDVVNFWGSQWWKNNQMSEFTSPGYPSFKGYADFSDNFCGGTWTTRPGNSSKPPKEIGPDVAIIVTSNVWKNGPNISGNIKEILIVHQDGNYGPNPGHDGNGPVTTVLCTSQEQEP